MKAIIALIVMLFVLIAGCDTQTNNTQLANPASVNCEEKGGTLNIIDTAEGQVGMCTLPDGSVCEEWALYRNECPKMIACTADAKVCPDGTALGRTGPNCEFPACPGEDTEGTLEGIISIGPICPVERDPPDPDCRPKPETFEAWKILVLRDSETIAELEPDKNGVYSISLEAGTYTLDFAEPHGIGGTELPKEITIRRGGTTEVNIDIDTGIR